MRWYMHQHGKAEKEWKQYRTANGVSRRKHINDEVDTAVDDSYEADGPQRTGLPLEP